MNEVYGLENIIEVITRMNDGNNGDLAKDLAEIQAEIKGLKKNKVANGISYLNGDKVLEYITPALAKRGILLHTSMVPGTSKVTPRYVETKNNPKKLKYEYEALAHFEFIKEFKVPLSNSDSDKVSDASYGYGNTQRIQGFYTVYGDQFDDTAKAKGTAETYSERYFLLKYFKIATDKDDADAKVSVGEIKQSTATAAVAAVKKVATKAKPVAEAKTTSIEAPALPYEEIEDLPQLTKEESEESQNMLKDYLTKNDVKDAADQMVIMKKLNDHGYKKAGEVPPETMKEILGGL